MTARRAAVVGSRGGWCCEAVLRRDAAQRLSLALTLLARACGEGRSDAGDGGAVPTTRETPARPGTQKEEPA